MVIVPNKKFKGHNVTRRTTPIRYLVIHYTGAEGTAADNVAYFNSMNRNASADYFINQNGVAYEYNPDPKNYYSWHCGGPLESSHHPYYGKCTNENSIAIEICTHYSNGKWIFTNQAFEGAVNLAKELMKRYSIPIERVIRHYDVTGKACPQVPGWGAVGGSSEWNRFKNAIVAIDILGGVKMPTIKQGSKGNAVKIWQVIVGAKVDGNFGAKTKAATKAFQKKYGLTQDGVVGPKTWPVGLKSIN